MPSIPSGCVGIPHFGAFTVVVDARRRTLASTLRRSTPDKEALITNLDAPVRAHALTHAYKSYF